ncbi:transglycosylase-associated protein [Salinisphaera sp. S4-8]
MTIVIGILGAVLGGFISTALGMGTVSGFNLGSFVIAILGAILLLWLYRVVKSR